MIAHLSGKITEKFGNEVVLDVGGVGYEVQLPAGDADICKFGDEVKFYTYHHVREQSEDLFGFSSLEGKKLFEMLLSVQGVGPKAAIAILSLAQPSVVRSAIANKDAAFIAKASGVGKRSAERVIVDLSDKVGLPAMNYQMDSAVPIGDDALDALIALGLSLQDATAALAGVDSSLAVEERVRLALKQR
jgi:Holliday junction DNA helicase RuvA